MRQALAQQIGIGFVVLACLFIAWPFIAALLHMPDIFANERYGQAVRYTGAALLIFPAIILLKTSNSRK